MQQITVFTHIFAILLRVAIIIDYILQPVW